MFSVLILLSMFCTVYCNGLLNCHARLIWLLLKNDFVNLYLPIIWQLRYPKQLAEKSTVFGELNGSSLPLCPLWVDLSLAWYVNCYNIVYTAGCLTFLNKVLGMIIWYIWIYKQIIYHTSLGFPSWNCHVDMLWIHEQNPVKALLVYFEGTSTT